MRYGCTTLAVELFISSGDTVQLGRLRCPQETVYAYETKVIMGLASIDELPQMLETLKSMNIERAIELKQNAVDRYFAR